MPEVEPPRSKDAGLIRCQSPPNGSGHFSARHPSSLDCGVHKLWPPYNLNFQNQKKQSAELSLCVWGYLDATQDRSSRDGYSVAPVMPRTASASVEALS